MARASVKESHLQGSAKVAETQAGTDPILVRVLDELLKSHRKWFTMQSEHDRFERVFRIHDLEGDAITAQFLAGHSVPWLPILPGSSKGSRAASATPADSTDNSTNTSPTQPNAATSNSNSAHTSTSDVSGANGSGSSESAETPAAIVAVDESAVELVMDLVLCSREEALALINEHQGNVSRILALFFE
ncbi:hypothetical protein BC831DRAFT_454802 [Entophlyctis helioformis]|nr:hypothetical protein BC831DRAFT_454802 [Entophlyctis helioformis]